MLVINEEHLIFFSLALHLHNLCHAWQNIHIVTEDDGVKFQFLQVFVNGWKTAMNTIDQFSVVFLISKSGDISYNIGDIMNK